MSSARDSFLDAARGPVLTWPLTIRTVDHVQQKWASFTLATISFCYFGSNFF